MRISDWSSDVCSSDLCRARRRHPMEIFNRRTMLAAAALGPLLTSPAASAGPRKFKFEAGSEGFRTFQAVHEGLGSNDVRLFDFGNAASPGNFLVYEITIGDASCRARLCHYF